MSTVLMQRVTLITEALFAPDKRRLNTAIYQLTQKNSALKGTKFYGFRHRGVAYIPDETRQLARITKTASLPSVALELTAEAETLIRDITTVDRDREQIQQLLTLLLEPCVYRQDVRDALPDCVVSLVPDLQHISRSQNPAWTIENNPRAMRLYAKFLPKIETYAAARLLY